VSQHQRAQTLAIAAVGVAALAVSCERFAPITRGLRLDGGTAQCDGGLTACRDSCVDLRRSSRHCGQCGRACNANEACVEAVCTPRPCADSGTCAQGCGDASECPPGEGCRADGECGACARLEDCRAGELCQAGICLVALCATNNGGCDALAFCAQDGGAALCTCSPGYVGTGQTCARATSCEIGNGGCAPTATCSRDSDTLSCSCWSGYTGDGGTCVDLDECASNTSACPANSDCANTPGAYLCACRAGYTGDGGVCGDIDECLSNNGGCDPRTSCANTVGGRTCGPCPGGYGGSGDTACVDLDECASNNGGCHATAICANMPGAYLCACRTGYTGDGGICVDIDECDAGRGGCSLLASCVNTMGSHTCGPCPTGFVGSGAGTCTSASDQEWSLWSVPPDSPDASTFLGDSLIALDPVTGLYWQRQGPPTLLSIQQALRYCEDLELGEFDDWRVPTLVELESIVDHAKAYPAIDLERFPETDSSTYWTTSGQVGPDGGYLWRVDFYYGESALYDPRQWNEDYVRCVR
jgi:hypothetical protein